MSGQQVGCPTCGSAVTVPYFSDPAPISPAPSPQAAPQTLQLGCPICTQPFQITSEMAGQTIACPHCNSAVTAPPLPDSGPSHPAAPPESPAPQQPASPQQPTAPQQPAVTAQQATPSPSKQEKKPKPVAAEKKAAKPASKVKEAPNKEASKAKSSPARQRASKDAKAAPVSARERSKPKQEPAGAAPVNAKVKAAGASPSPLTAPRASEIESLLPPRWLPESPIEPGDRVPLPAAPAHPQVPQRGADGSIFLPTDGGGYVAVREPVKRVGAGDHEVELRRLSPEEKARRRLKRNVIMGVAGVLALIVAAMLLQWGS